MGSHSLTYRPSSRTVATLDSAWKELARFGSPPWSYSADKGLEDAVNVSLLLSQPLLLTGEPGTGKTQLAYSLAWELGMDPPLKYETKSTTTARDLFYSYDILGRLRDAQSKVRQDISSYLEFRPLGKAILRARASSESVDWLPEHLRPDLQARCRSVVLIDEIDKAPRDVPNDILNEIEQMYFRIPEVGNRLVQADPDLRPILVFTSNSEKHLPDTFLRRCVYYDIPFPSRSKLADIVAGQIESLQQGSCPLLSDAVDLFQFIRAPDRGFSKPPGTAELLNWLNVLVGYGLSSSDSLRDRRNEVERSLSSLVKTAEDQKNAIPKALQDWFEKSPGARD